MKRLKQREPVVDIPIGDASGRSGLRPAREAIHPYAEAFAEGEDVRILGVALDAALTPFGA